MFQDGLDHLPVFNEVDPHPPLTFRAGQGVYFIDLLDQPSPILPVFLRALIRFQNGGEPLVLGFFPLSPGDIAINP